MSHGIKLRYTFAENASPMEITAEMLSLCRSGKELPEFLSVGIEKYDKFARPTNTHVHIHMICKESGGALRKRLVRHFEASDEKRKGVSLYSLKEEDDIKDINRFLRYPFKQYKHDESSTDMYQQLASRCKLPCNFDKLLEAEMAYDEWSKNVEFVLEKERKLHAPSTKDSLFEYLDGLHKIKPFTDRKRILTEILNHYAAKESSANKNTCLGYMYTACIKYNVITSENLAGEWLQ